MFDMFNSDAARLGATVSVFNQNDPAQLALRTVLDGLSERELAELEQDLDYFARSGIMSARIEAILADSDDRFEAIA